MENTQVTLHFTREFTSGTLKGLRHEDSIRFVSRDAAADYLTAGRKGFKAPICGSPYKIVGAVIV
jgi:hypothetical protein